MAGLLCKLSRYKFTNDGGKIGVFAQGGSVFTIIGWNILLWLTRCIVLPAEHLHIR